MRRWHRITAAGAFAVALPAAASDEFVRAEVSGSIAKRESAGFEIRSGAATWLLDLSASDALLADASRLEGRRAVAKGSYGGGAPSRPKLLVEGLRPDDVKRPEGVDVSMRGRLRAGVMAIGAETTGITLTAAGTAWELDVRGRQRDRVGELDGRTVTVEGTLRFSEGVETGRRAIVKVRRIQALPSPQPSP